MSEPKTPLGRIFYEQARQDVPDDLDGWPEIFSRLEAKGIAPKTTTQESSPDFALHIPENNRKNSKKVETKNKKQEKIEVVNFYQPKAKQVVFKQRKSLALTGLGLVAALAIFVIIASVFILGDRGSTPVVSDTTTSQAVFAGATSTPLGPSATPTPFIAPSLGDIPQDCGPAPLLQNLSPDFASMAGGNPVGMVGFNKQGEIELSADNPTKFGYPQKVLWTAAPTFSGTGSIQGTNLKTGQPLWFDVNAKPVTTFTFDTRQSGTTRSGWFFWDTEIAAPEAGCYRIAATWPGGSWTVTLALGKATANSTTPPTATAASTATPTPQTLGGVTVNGVNFSKQGKLAFVSNGNLFVLDGANGQTHQLTQNGGVSEFKWSYDGEWLAYKVSLGAAGSGDAIYMSKYDGTGNFMPPGNGEFAWSPIKEELAFTTFSPNGVPGDLKIVDTNKTVHKTISKNVSSLLWSPDGLTLAYATFDKIPDGTVRIETIPTTDKVVFQNNSPVSAQEGAGIKLLSWWPDGKGLLFQNIPANSASLSMDGLPVKSVDLTNPTALPHQLVKALVNTDWLSGWQEIRGGRRGGPPVDG